MTDGEHASQAVIAVATALYESIGTPPPAPGIQRLAVVVVRAAEPNLFEHWSSHLRDELADGGSIAVIAERTGASEKLVRQILEIAADAHGKHVP